MSRKAKDRKRTDKIGVHVTPEEKEILRRRAEELGGLTISDVVRMLIRQLRDESKAA
jgi:antitoxin component of RelBE/YafQ-DinJ toxin-antitoxin module